MDPQAEAKGQGDEAEDRGRYKGRVERLREDASITEEQPGESQEYCAWGKEREVEDSKERQGFSIPHPPQIMVSTVYKRYLRTAYHPFE